MKTYRIEFTHKVTDVYYIDADSKEEAQDMFENGEFDEPDDTYEYDDDYEVKVFLDEE